MLFRSYRSKLQAALLLLGLAGIGLTVWEASDGATRALRAATRERLVSIRETRGRQIQRYFEDVGNHVLALSSDEATISALEQFAASWPSIPAAGPAEVAQLESFYRTSFAEVTAKEPLGAEILARWFPADPRTLRLQHVFVASNPYPLGSKYHLLSAADAGGYGAVHARYHPTLQRYRSAFGFYDIFLMEGASGRILYSVMKEVDLGVVLTEDPYRRTGLAAAWKRAMEVPEPETWVIEDYAPYLPSHLAPAAFAAAPVYRAGRPIGVLAIQLSIAEVNRVMTGDRRWAEDGLGKTGQAYILASDGTLRSDLRPEIENPAEFYRDLQRSGVPAEKLERIRRHGTAVLNLQPEAIPKRREVLQSKAAVPVHGLDWRLVAEIDAGEAFDPVSRLRWRMLLNALGIAVALFLAARLLGAAVTRPVLRLADGARQLGRGDFQVRLPVDSSDEIGKLAESFNSMAAELQETTVSRKALDRILNSLINGVFVVAAERGSSAEAILAAPLKNANVAALQLLGYEPGELNGLRFDQILAGDDAVWRDHLSRLVGTGRLPAMETALTTKAGPAIPVLFSASWLTSDDGKEPGLVCVSQDISEWKETQEKLRVLTERLITAQEEERGRLARELHDDLTQRMAAVAIDAGRLERLLPAANGQSRELLERIRQQMAELSGDVHGLSRRLHPSALDDLGLPAAIESESRAFFERGGAPVEFSCSGSFEAVPRPSQLALYRIVQEALRNVHKHSGADEVRVRLTNEGERVKLAIVDNGRGFDPQAPNMHGGIGLASIEERVRLMGGRLKVCSQPGHGTRILVSIPSGAQRE